MTSELDLETGLGRAAPDHLNHDAAIHAERIAAVALLVDEAITEARDICAIFADLNERRERLSELQDEIKRGGGALAPAVQTAVFGNLARVSGGRERYRGTSSGCSRIRRARSEPDRERRQRRRRARNAYCDREVDGPRRQVASVSCQSRDRDVGPNQTVESEKNTLRVLQLKERGAVRILHGFDPKDRCGR